jgi:hypothetical protein
MGPLETVSDPEIFEVVMVFPTGSGKSTAYEVIIPYATCEDPGNVLCAGMTDALPAAPLNPLVGRCMKIR